MHFLDQGAAELTQENPSQQPSFFRDHRFRCIHQRPLPQTKLVLARRFPLVFHESAAILTAFCCFMMPWTLHFSLLPEYQARACLPPFFFSSALDSGRTFSDIPQLSFLLSHAYSFKTLFVSRLGVFFMPTSGPPFLLSLPASQRTQVPSSFLPRFNSIRGTTQSDATS